MKADKLIYAILVIFIVPIVLAAGGGGGGGGGSGGGGIATCTSDTWSCSSWSDCSVDNTQTRTCTLTNDCAGIETQKPVEVASCTYVSNLISSLKCSNLASLNERVACRLDLSENDLKKELEIAYLPEECRNINDNKKKDECILLYGSSQKCWILPIGDAREGCLKNILNIKDIQTQKQDCNNNQECLGNLKNNVYALIKFRFYDLEERAEELYEKDIIDKNKAADIIAKLEEEKVKFNEAKNKDERKQIILDTKKLWGDFITNLR